MLRGQLAEEREHFELEIAAQRATIEDLQLSLTLQRANLRSCTYCLLLRFQSGQWGWDEERLRVVHSAGSGRASLDCGVGVSRTCV
jgi:hypothetical protein